MSIAPVVHLQVHPGYLVARRMGAAGTVRRECPGLGHPRTLMGNFGQVQAAFREALRELCGGGLLAIAPRVVVQLPPDPPGGYTDVELRAFDEAAQAAGARRSAVVVEPAPLSDERVLQALR